MTTDAAGVPCGCCCWFDEVGGAPLVLICVVGEEGGEAMDWDDDDGRDASSPTCSRADVVVVEAPPGGEGEDVC